MISVHRDVPLIDYTNVDHDVMNEITEIQCSNAARIPDTRIKDTSDNIPMRKVTVPDRIAMSTPMMASLYNSAAATHIDVEHVIPLVKEADASVKGEFLPFCVEVQTRFVR